MLSAVEGQTVLQLIMIGGASGALFWVLKLVVDGKLHTTSEVSGLREDKEQLMRVNGDLQRALSEQNEQLEKLVDILRGNFPRGT